MMSQFNYDDLQILKSKLLEYLRSAGNPSGALDYLEGELSYLIKDKERVAEIIATLENELLQGVPPKEAMSIVMNAIAPDLFGYVYGNQEYD